MIIQKGIKKDVVLRRYVIGVHPIIQFFMDKLKINEILVIEKRNSQLKKYQEIRRHFLKNHNESSLIST